jgi:hypothetical protein
MDWIIAGAQPGLEDGYVRLMQRAGEMVLE